MRIIGFLFIYFAAIGVSQSQDLRFQVFEENYPRYQAEGLSTELMENIIEDQEAFVGNFCGLCGCCSIKHPAMGLIEWKSDRPVDKAFLAESRISVVPKTQFEILKESIEALEANAGASATPQSPVITDISKIVEMIAAKKEFCDACNCCDGEYGFDLPKAVKEGLVSPITDSEGDSNQQVYIVPRWIVLDGIGKLME